MGDLERFKATLGKFPQNVMRFKATLGDLNRHKTTSGSIKELKSVTITESHYLNTTANRWTLARIKERIQART